MKDSILPRHLQILLAECSAYRAKIVVKTPEKEKWGIGEVVRMAFFCGQIHVSEDGSDG